MYLFVQKHWGSDYKIVIEGKGQKMVADMVEGNWIERW